MDYEAKSVAFTVLVVDDTETNIDILTEALADDYEVMVALSGEEALEVVAEEPPDLILLDIMMPEMDGYEVCRRLKDDENTRDIPIIFVTALSEAVDEARGLELGAVDYITKPFNPAVVRARVRNHLALRRARLELVDRNRRLVEAARLREDVDNIMRHDLKGPLNTIIGLPGLMSRDSGLSPDHLRSLKSIEESGFIMLNMINLSLDLFKMERGVYELQPQTVDLIATFRKIFSDLESQAQPRNLTMELLLDGRPAGEAEGFSVTAENLLAYSMFNNLVRNAVEAVPDGGTVRVSLTREDDGPRIDVFNHGTVPESIRDRFFEKYVTAGKSGGTGLGTYSARLMAETLNGTIRLTASDASGTTITVRLPPAEEINAPAPARPPREIPADLPDMHLLVVDDDPHGRELIVRYLNHPALRVDVAGDGRQALERMTAARYDLVFMDAEMPVMNGLDAAARYREWEADHRSAAVPMVALTGHDTPEMHQKLLDAGFNGHLVKPVTAADLYDALSDPAGASGQGRPLPAPEPDEAVRVDADFEPLIMLFLDEIRQALAGYLQRLPDMDLEIIGRFGHTVAGTGRMYGLIRAGGMGAELEQAANSGETGEIPSIMTRMAAYLETIRIAFVEKN